MTRTLERGTQTAELNVVLCGSFRRDPAGLADMHRRLLTQFNLLSPSGVDFIDTGADFVRLPNEVGEAAHTIEAKHLAAILHADFLWLHAPDGYVGTSAAMEIGHARGHGIPVFTDEVLQDETLRGCVALVSRPEDVPSSLSATPGAALTGLQQYYGRVSQRRGWDKETPQDTLLLLTEELGELARAVRKAAGIRRDGAYPTDDIGHEIADLQLYLLHLANCLGVDLARAVTQKELINARRFAETSRSDVA